MIMIEVERIFLTQDITRNNMCDDVHVAQQPSAGAHAQDPGWSGAIKIVKMTYELACPHANISKSFAVIGTLSVDRSWTHVACSVYIPLTYLTSKFHHQVPR
jgi:hypothetical protein